MLTTLACFFGVAEAYSHSFLFLPVYRLVVFGVGGGGPVVRSPNGTYLPQCHWLTSAVVATWVQKQNLQYAQQEMAVYTKQRPE